MTKELGLGYFKHMLDINYVRENIDYVKKKLETRGGKTDLDAFLNLDKDRRELLKESEQLRNLKNTTSEEIGKLRREGNDTGPLQKRMKEVSERIKELEDKLKVYEEEIQKIWVNLPNLPDDSVPVGEDETHNLEIRRFGKRPEFDFEPRDHVELGSLLKILDMDRASNIAGARFALYVGQGAKLERALINFMLDVHTKEHGYQEILPPFVANKESFFGTGNLPKFEADLFKLAHTDYYLVPTGEVPITNIYRNEILQSDQLPKYFVAYTPCFRSEAGSYGKDTRGLIRQHQFNKVELVKLTTPDNSFDELEKLTEDAENILKRLDLHYRVVVLCTADMGFSSAKTYDIEVWVPSQNKFREISSCSNFLDFQARRAKIRYRPAAGAKPRFVHTLNGSGLAVGRTWVAIVENYQQKDGAVIIPEALRPYMDGMERIEKSFSL